MTSHHRRPRFTVSVLSTFELGSSVLFPCNFDIRKQHFSISWKHDLNSLVIFPSVGHVQFLLPERGRVKVFPNLGSRGNFSIRIDGLVFSDLGCYCCVHAETSDCHRVELVTAEGRWGF
uniref:Ig-like domain-containing protein n=1 Tax=Cynoglossus semilaevis TaxID=244447 RepID=A0A3P8UTU5_CYNSE